MLNSLQKAAIRHLVAYEFSPPDARLSHTAWCDIAGITTRSLEMWRHQSEFASALSDAMEQAEATSDMFAVIGRQVALEHLLAMLTDKSGKMTPTEKRAVIKDILAQTSHVAIDNEAVDYRDFSDADLARMCLNRKVSPEAMTEAELLRLASDA
jgi:hypothetical protein